jgi:hypothetical protein
MYDAAIIQAAQVTHAATTTADGGGGVSSLLVVTVAGMAVFLTAGIVRTALKVFSAFLSAAVRIGTAVIALGFGALVLGVVYVAERVFNFVPS